MRIKVVTYGSLSELFGKEFNAEANDMEELMAALKKEHSSLTDRKFLVAVNNQIIKENTIFKKNDVVALMPPYSGG